MDLASIWTPEGRARAYSAEIMRRMEIVRALTADRKIRAVIMTHYKSSAAGLVDWVQDFGITYDPRNQDPIPKVMPFMLFQRQIEFLEFLHECWSTGQSGLCEKARDMGASWLCVAFSAWVWTFHEGSATGWGSRKGDLVDNKDDMKAIFPKIRMQLDYLPYWMRPVGFDPEKHATYMKIINPENGATIIGEAGDNIGRGGRTSIYFKDESAHYEHAEAIEAALGDNTNVQIDISSVNGTANIFYKRRMAGKVWEPGREIESGFVRVFIMDWRDHPGKDQTWYEEKRAKAVREGLLHVFAQETERNYSAAIDRLIIHPDWIEAAIDADKDLAHLGRFDDGEKVAGQDVADGGRDQNAQVIRHGVVAKFAEAWGGDAGEAADPSVHNCMLFGVNELYYDSIGVGAGFKTAINQKKTNGTLPLNLRVMKWNAGAGVLDPTDPIDPTDPESPTNEDFFSNLKAQGWWRLRTRFYKTYRARRFGDKYDPGELISLPSNMPGLHDLKMQLAQAVHKYDKKGKTMVDKTPEGQDSPNLGDGCVICYNPTRELSIFDVL